MGLSRDGSAQQRTYRNLLNGVEDLVRFGYATAIAGRLQLVQ